MAPVTTLLVSAEKGQEEGGTTAGEGTHGEPHREEVPAPSEPNELKKVFGRCSKKKEDQVVDDLRSDFSDACNTTTPPSTTTSTLSSADSSSSSAASSSPPPSRQQSKSETAQEGCNKLREGRVGFGGVSVGTERRVYPPPLPREEAAWDALIVYSELTDAQLCGEEEDSDLSKRKRRRHFRCGGAAFVPGGLGGDEEAVGSTAVRPEDVRSWPEFRGNRWTAQAPRGWDQLLEEAVSGLEERFSQMALHGPRNVWVVKPGTNSKGSGVIPMHTLPEILHSCTRMTNRVVQKYLERPLLLFNGRKFDIRQWVLVRALAPKPRVFVFSEPYLRLCNDMYDLGDLQNRQRHVSNWSVNKRGKQQEGREGAVATLEEFKEELREVTGEEGSWEKKLWPRIGEIALQTVEAARHKVKPRADSFELYGFDFAVDEELRPWLLEVNLSPACEARTPHLDQLTRRMASRLVELCVLGKEEPDGLMPDWIQV